MTLAPTKKPIDYLEIRYEQEDFQRTDDINARAWWFQPSNTVHAAFADGQSGQQLVGYRTRSLRLTPRVDMRS